MKTSAVIERLKELNLKFDDINHPEKLDAFRSVINLPHIIQIKPSYFIKNTFPTNSKACRFLKAKRRAYRPFKV